MKSDINIKTLIQINKIIERDRLSSTYKFALLKGTIDTIQRYDHWIIKDNNDIVNIPVFLIAESWFFDYLPFVYEKIRQQNRGNVLNNQIEELYQILFDILNLKGMGWEYAYNTIFQRYTYFNFDNDEKKTIFKLLKRLTMTIVNMPMKYIGDKKYEIFKPNNINTRLRYHEKLLREDLIKEFGYFSLHKDFYTVFKYLGQNLFGISTIAKRWKETTINLNSAITIDKIEKIIFKTFNNRDTTIVKNLLPHECECVWTGKKLFKYDIDHLLPYSVWFNNDLWNLLPSDPRINRKKSDKIPTPNLIEKRKKTIKFYWSLYKEKDAQTFINQIKISLGDYKSFDSYIKALCKKSDYLINDRGLEPFEI